MSHLFEIICRGWTVGLADHMMHMIASINSTAVDQLSAITDILCQGVDPLAQWLEHWISTPAVRIQIP